MPNYYTTYKKYNNKKTLYNGIKYDSKLEAGVAGELDLMMKADKNIKEIKKQVSFPLMGLNKTKICSYIADFVIYYKNGDMSVVEAKGIETDVFKLKLKLFLDNYPNIEFTMAKAKNWYNPRDRKNLKK